MLNCLGFSDIILQCDPEPSLNKSAESVKSKRQERTVIRSSPRRSHQCNGAVENYQKPLQGQVRTLSAALQDRTQYRPTTDSALMKWILACSSFQVQRCTVTILSCNGVVRIVEKLLEFGQHVLAHLPEVGKGSGNPAPMLADRWKSAVWLGKSGPPTSICSEPMKGLCAREACDDSPRTAGQKQTFEQSSTHHRNQSRRHWTSLLQLTLLLVLLQYLKCMKMRRRNPQGSQRKTKRCRESHQTQR